MPSEGDFRLERDLSDIREEKGGLGVLLVYLKAVSPETTRIGEAQTAAEEEVSSFASSAHMPSLIPVPQLNTGIAQPPRQRGQPDC